MCVCVCVCVCTHVVGGEFYTRVASIAQLHSYSTDVLRDEFIIDIDITIIFAHLPCLHIHILYKSRCLGLINLLDVNLTGHVFNIVYHC